MDASRLLGHTKKPETVYRTVTGRWVCNSQFCVAKYEILFGLDFESYIFHLSLCSSVLNFQTFQEVVLLFPVLWPGGGEEKKKKVYDQFQYWTMNSCVAEIHPREWSLSRDYPQALYTVTPLLLYLYLVHYFVFDLIKSYKKKKQLLGCILWKIISFPNLWLISSLVQKHFVH